MLEVDELMDKHGGRGLGTGLITLILGGVVLWVGKTTFEHAGQLAGIRNQVEGLDNQHYAFRDRYDELVSSISERTNSRFTREDAEKLTWHVKDLEIEHDTLKDEIHRSFGGLRLQVASLETQSRIAGTTGFQTVSGVSLTSDFVSAQLVIHRLQGEISNLRAEVDRLHRMVGYNRGQIQYPVEVTQPVRILPTSAQFPVRIIQR